MKEIFASVFIGFLMIVHGMIMFVALHEIITKSPEIENAMLFLFAFACFGTINDITFIITLCWPSRLTYSYFKSYFYASYYLYIVMHVTGVLYFIYYISFIQVYASQLPYRIYIFYLVIDCGIFYVTFELLTSIMEEAKKQLISDVKRTGNTDVTKKIHQD